MQAYTIVVGPGSSGEGLYLATMVPPGLIVEGRSIKGCLDRAGRALAGYEEDLSAVDWESRSAEGALQGDGSAGSAEAQLPVSDSEALDALRRAGAALAAVEADLGTEIARRPLDDQEDLRRARVALLRARATLVDAAPGVVGFCAGPCRCD